MRKWTEDGRVSKSAFNLQRKLLWNKKNKENRKAWISDETVKLIEERQKYKCKTDENGEQTYKKINGEIKRKLKK